MRMYPEHDLYRHYKKHAVHSQFSSALPDVTKRVTLENMNYAINVADKWDTCLDIGGGSGHYLAGLAQKFKKAILVEVQNLPEHEILKKNLPNVEIFHSYIEKCNISEKVDFILLADLYEHIPNIQDFVTKLSFLQTTGGVVYIMTPNPVYCGPAPESGIYHTQHTNGHIKQYTQHEIMDLMSKNGYSLVLRLYEEAPFRQKAKKFIFALSRRDKNWNNHFWYVFIRPIFLLFTMPCVWLLDKLTHRSEIKHQHNELVTLTQDLVFKKTDET